MVEMNDINNGMNSMDVLQGIASSMYQPIKREVPSKEKLERAKKVLNERLKASKKIVNSRKERWSVWDKLYKNEQVSQKIAGESNLVLPKADYIAETISAKVINSLFSVQDWITLKHSTMDPKKLKQQQDWFMWVLDRKVNFYLTALEMFKSSPIKGTSICKVYMKNFWPFVDYINLEDFYPDVMSRKPGDIQAMRYCMHQFRRDLNQIKSFTNSQGQPIYINIEKLVEAGESRKKEAVPFTQGASSENISVKDEVVPIFDLIEYHGEFEYERGKYGEYILTGWLKDKNSDEVEDIIRCDKSSFKIRDRHADRDIYLKPFVSSIYSIVPGEFYGKSAIQSVESLITQQTELHNIYMDNHKRLVNGIVKILNRSDLTRDHIPQVAGATWYMDSFDDVEVETPPETNLQAYRTIHELLDMEIEKASGVTRHNLGVGKTKRETLGEVRSLLSEASERFKVFIQMADRLTLRPMSTQVYALLRQTFDIFGSQNFMVSGKEMVIEKDDLREDMDVSFAATTVESEESKYSKQQTFPQVMQVLQQLAGDRLNIEEVITEFAGLYNYRNPQRFLHPSPVIPISALPPELQQLAMQIKAQLENDQESGIGGGNGSSPMMPQQQLPGTMPQYPGGGMLG